MRVTITKSRVRSILTRTSGYLKTVTSHSVQPYRGCTFGNSLCGVGCAKNHSLDTCSSTREEDSDVE